MRADDAASRPPTNRLAAVALGLVLLGIASWALLFAALAVGADWADRIMDGARWVFPLLAATGALAPLAGAICGHAATRQLRRRPGERGFGVTATAIALGWAMTGLVVIGAVIVVIFVVALTKH